MLEQYYSPEELNPQDLAAFKQVEEREDKIRYLLYGMLLLTSSMLAYELMIGTRWTRMQTLTVYYIHLTGAAVRAVYLRFQRLSREKCKRYQDDAWFRLTGRLS